VSLGGGGWGGVVGGWGGGGGGWWVVGGWGLGGGVVRLFAQRVDLLCTEGRCFGLSGYRTFSRDGSCEGGDC